jgi:hypothetical protein
MSGCEGLSSTFERLGKTEARARKPNDEPPLIHRSPIVCTLGLYGGALSQPRGKGVDIGTAFAATIHLI